jgi:energy-coupling factor transport system ATP-binding protein
MPTVAADVAFGLGRYTMAEAEVQTRVAASLRLVNMSDYTYRATHTLSGGQKQRVAIAGCLAENPRLLLLDELTTFLDVEDQFGVLDAVRNVTHERGGVTAIWVTHRFEELEYADSASYMADGKIAFTGSPGRMRDFLRSLGAPVDLQTA